MIKQSVKVVLLSRELLLRICLIQALGPGPESLFSSWWIAIIAFFLRPACDKKKLAVSVQYYIKCNVWNPEKSSLPVMFLMCL